MERVYAESNRRARAAALAWMATRALGNRDVMRLVGQWVWARRMCGVLFFIDV